MKSSHQIAILAAVGVGAYLLLKSSTAAGTVRLNTGMTTGYPTGTQPQVGTPAYAAYLAQQQQAALQNAQMSALYGVGKLVNGWFSGPSVSVPTGAGNLTGTIRPSTDYGTFTYQPPDMSASNSPYVGTIYTQDIMGAPALSSSDNAFLHSNDAYGFYTQ